jgi:hypothetical protein
MADDVPVVERRRVVIELVMTGPPWQKPAAEATPPIRELAEMVRDELIRLGSRNPNIFGGRA